MAEDNSQEKGYEVKDKRRVNPDGTLKEDQEQQPAEAAPEQAEAEQVEEPPAESAAAEEQAEEQPTQREPHTHDHPDDEEMPPPNVYQLLEFVAGMLTEQAWQLMGIRLAPGQKELIKDMTQAKLAIDTVAFIAEKLQPHVGEEDRKALRGLISDLQMNFVVQSR